MMYPFYQNRTNAYDQGAHNQGVLMHDIGSSAFFTALEQSLPAVFTRHTASQALGGLIAVKTFSNLDALGQGVPNKVRIGNKVGYERDSFIQWLKARLVSY